MDRNRTRFLLATLGLVFLTQHADAIGNDPTLDINHFHPRPGSSGGKILGVDLGEIGPHYYEEDEQRKRDPNIQFYEDKWKFEVVPQLFLHYANSPLKFTIGEGTDSQKTLGYIVKHRLTGDLSLSFSLLRRIQFALSLPVTLYQSGDFIDQSTIPPSARANLPYPIATAGQEDLRFSVKTVFYNTKLDGKAHNVHFGIGAVGEVAFPTGDANNFLGSSGVNGDLRLIAHIQWKRVTAAINFGGHFAATEKLVNVQTGHGLVYGVGAQVELFRHQYGPFYLLTEVNGNTHYPFNQLNNSPAELSAAVKTDVNDWSFYLGGGPGLNKGYGIPDGRVFTGVSYAWHKKPQRVPTDVCSNIEGIQPNLPKGMIKDGAGHCVIDVCPNLNGIQSEIPNGMQYDDQGNCILDQCTNLPGLQSQIPQGMIQEKDKDGNEICIAPPPPDQCPNLDGRQEKIPEGMVKDTDGNCVKPDLCPNLPGLQEKIPDGMIQDKDGKCVKPKLVVERDDQFDLANRIFFDLDKAIIKPQSFPILDEVVAILKARPDVIRVRIEGHTDTVGKRLYNIDLSKRRAAAVVKYLVDHGIESNRLVAVGFGVLCPSKQSAGKNQDPRKINIEKANNTPNKRATNRRVDFIIMERAGKPQKPPRCGEPPELGKFPGYSG